MSYYYKKAAREVYVDFLRETKYNISLGLEHLRYLKGTYAGFSQTRAVSLYLCAVEELGCNAHLYKWVPDDVRDSITLPHTTRVALTREFLEQLRSLYL